MTSVEESVLNSMDGTDNRLLLFLPYIFQDVWELGASPEVIINLIQKHFHDYSKLKLIDLGCGKGAVSIKTAKEFGCICLGIDAIPEFIDEAGKRAVAFKVNHLCTFEAGDIRNRVDEFKGFDLVILGAIGNVFGNYSSTLKKVSKCIKPNGKIIIDDAYTEDEGTFTHPGIERRSSVIKQINDEGMKLIDEITFRQKEISDSEDFIFKKLNHRCDELIEKYPEKKRLFLDYISNQKKAAGILEKNVTCSTMLIEK